MLRQTIKTGVAALIMAGTALTWVGSAEARKSGNDHGYRGKPVKIAVVSPRTPQAAYDVGHYLKDYLPQGTRLVRNPNRADYVIHLRQKHFDTDLRIKDKSYEWAHSGHKRKKRYGVYGQRIGWTEVSAIALAHYEFRVVLKDHYGKVLDKDRISGRARQHVQWGEDLRVSTPRGYRPTQYYPNGHVRQLFDQAPGTGHGPKAQILHKVAKKLARQIARQTIPQTQYVAYKGYEKGHGGKGRRDDGYRQSSFNRYGYER